jgi:hypothetical protein
MIKGSLREPKTAALNRHQKGTIRCGTGADEATHTSMTTSLNERMRHRSAKCVRIDTEEVTSSILVSPTTNGLVKGFWEAQDRAVLSSAAGVSN